MLLEFKSILDLIQKLPTEKDCRNYFAYIRWGEKPVCPYCECDKAYTMSDTRYKCSKCQKKFTVKVGTIFENSKLPLQKWFIAIFLLSTRKKGISSVQLSKELDITQKTAWYMIHRIREVVSFSDKQVSGILEIDETYVGGKEKNRHTNKRIAHSAGGSTKEAVLGIVERKGELILKQTLPVYRRIGHTNRYTVKTVIDNVVSKDAIVITDTSSVQTYEAVIYNKILGKRDRRLFNHSRHQYGNGDIYTNTIEGVFSIVTRSIYGIYHFVSKKYLNEIVFRYNNRKERPSSITHSILCNTGNKYLPYSILIGAKNE